MPQMAMLLPFSPVAVGDARAIRWPVADGYARGMNPPRIGIPLCLDDRGRWRDGSDYLYVDARYAEAIERAGGVPLHLPIQADAPALVAGLDGLLLPGGDDFPSDRPLPTNVQLDLAPARQVAFDGALLEAARGLGRPVLGICYGMQLLVRTAGGALEPHLPSSGEAVHEHRLPEADRHGVEVVPGTRLAAILGAGAKKVNSLHHQGVRAVGPGQRVAARAADGVIEAVEGEGDGSGSGSWEIGVQWHPEKMDDETSDRLFAAFIEACRGEASRSAGPGAPARA